MQNAIDYLLAELNSKHILCYPDRIYCVDDETTSSAITSGDNAEFIHAIFIEILANSENFGEIC